jgi:hypothetical protein
MSGLLEEVHAAHGGIHRWQAVTSLTASGSFGGLLRSRFPGNRLASFTVTVRLAEQYAVFDDFPDEGKRAVFDRGDVRIEAVDGKEIESRRDARAAFSGLSSLRRNLRWDALDATYFAGYAWWNYLAMPVLLTREGVVVTEVARPERGERWRRLEIEVPPDIHTHSPRQTFHVDADGLIRRHDYVAQPVGRWARAAHHCGRYEDFAGLVIATRRRVSPRGPGGRSLRHPTLVALDIDRIEVGTVT